MAYQAANRKVEEPDPVLTDMDGYLVSAQVEQLTAYKRRWINELIRHNKFPPPDVPGKNGSPNRWRRSTIRRVLDEMQHGKGQA